MFVGSAPPTQAQATTKRDSVADCLPRREPTLDVRANLARIAERARQLNADRSQTRVARGISSLAEFARREAEEAAAETAGKDNQAGAELFLAARGFDVNEQRRLLHHIATTRPTVAFDDAAAASSDSTAAAQIAASKAADVSSFVAAARNEALTTMVRDVFVSVEERQRELSEVAVARLWEARKMELAATVGMRNLLQSATLGQPAVDERDRTIANGAPSPHDISGVLVPVSRGGRADAVAVSSSSLGAAPTPKGTKAILAARTHDFAMAVAAKEPSEWLSSFVDVARRRYELPESDALLKLWLTLDRLLTTLQANPQPNASDEDLVLGGVDGSRSVLEQEFTFHILAEVHGIAPEAMVENSSMAAEKFVDTATTYAQGSDGVASPWAVVFLCMRAGRYDAAALCATEEAVRTALLDVAAVPATGRALGQASDLSILRDLTALYRQQHTQRDPYRGAVLLLLLAGDAGSESDAQARVDECVGRVSTSLDTVLWFRLVLVRSVGTVAGLCSLEDVQRRILNEQQSLLATVNTTGDLCRILMLAMLPASALRVLSDRGGECMADAIHMALVLDGQGLLSVTDRAVPPQVEVPLDLRALLQRHVQILSTAATPLDGGVHAGTAAFEYFGKTGNVPSFVELCARSETLCALFFGPTGLLLRHGVLNSTLVDAMGDIAKRAGATGFTSVARKMYMTVHAHVSNREARNAALHSAHALLSPALTQALGRALNGGNATALLSLAPDAAAVANALPGTSAVPSEVLDGFLNLCTIAEAVAAFHSRQYETAIARVMQLSFVPIHSSETDAKAFAMRNALPQDALALMPAVVVMALRTMLELFHQLAHANPERARLREQAAVLRQWHMQWPDGGGQEVFADIRRIMECLLSVP